MSEANKTSRFTPEGWQTLTPRIVVERVPELVEFLKSVFDATGDYTADRPTVMKIGSSR
jgi:PhnB protein